MKRWSRAALAGCAAGCVALPAALADSAGTAGASGISVRVTPDRGLAPGQNVTITGHGLGRPAGNGTPKWFVTECTAAVRGRMNPTTDTPHCDITHAQSIRISGGGSFTAHYRVVTGIVGDGYCGTAGHNTCVIAVGTASGKGTAVRVTFQSPPPPTTTTNAG